MNALQSSLSFFQPVYLWALGFLSVILFLHFFRRRVVKRMDISTLRFLPPAAVNRSRVKKIMDLLLLLARLLLVIALIFIFAGLHDKDSPLVALRDPRGVVYTWIDPTMSMEFSEGGKPAGQRAMKVVDSLINILPPTVEHYRFDYESGRFVLFNRADDDGSAQNNFAGRFGHVNLEEAADAFMAAVSSASSVPGTFVVLSDFQRSTTEVFDSLSSRLINGIRHNNSKIICVAFTPSVPHNYSIEARVNPALKNEVSAVVRAHGMALDTAVVELTVGDLRIGQRNVSCVKDDSVIVTFDMPSARAGSWGKFTLHAADPLPFDNADYFTISEEQSRSVFIIGNMAHNRVVEAVLRASAPMFWEPIVRKEGGSDLLYEDLNAADLVIVNSFSGRSRLLESFIAGAGGDKGIIITLDPDREDDFGRAFLRNSGLPTGSPDVTTIERGTNPVLADTNTALWRGFPAVTSGNARIYRHITNIPGNALVRLGNAQMLASIVRHHNSYITIISTPIGITNANNLCETGFFVPFIDRLSRRTLAGRGQAEGRWYAGYATRNPLFGTSHTGTLYEMDGKLVTSWSSSQPFVRIEQPGIYSLVLSTGETILKAVSSHPLESEMTFIRPDIQHTNDIYFFEYRQFLEQTGNLANNVWSHWLWVILGLLLCMEVLLWKRFGARKSQNR